MATDGKDDGSAMAKTMANDGKNHGIGEVGGELSLSSEILHLSEADPRSKVTYTARENAPLGLLGVVRFEYEAGVTVGRGAGPWAMPRDQGDDLLECVRVHGKGADGKPYTGAELQEWLRTDSEVFARWVRGLPRVEYEKAHWNYNPRAFLRWLNEEAGKTQASHEPKERPSGVRKVGEHVAAANMFGLGLGHAGGSNGQ
jgi:hypothetical protein